MQPNTTAGALRHAVKGVITQALGIRRTLPNRRAVLLTFDDGPIPSLTTGILERLCDVDARAVFFSVGHHVRDSGDVLRQVVAAGHEIGNHTFMHPLQAPAKVSELVADLRRCQEAVQARTGAPPRLFRPPFGQLRLNTVMAARSLALKTVLWSVDAHDWAITSKTEAAARGREVAEAVAPGDIVLLHEQEHILTLLDHLLPSLAARDLDLSGGVEDL
jgi:peptidoglycan/xylan/chitin deacetylase (PgdA/CDA1 family)